MIQAIYSRPSHRTRHTCDFTRKHTEIQTLSQISHLWIIRSYTDLHAIIVKWHPAKIWKQAVPVVLHRTGKNLKSTIINKLEASESTVQSLGRSVGSVEAWVTSSAMLSEWHLTFWNASGEDVGTTLNNGQPDTRCFSHSITFPGTPQGSLVRSSDFPECHCISPSLCSTVFFIYLIIFFGR